MWPLSIHLTRLPKNREGPRFSDLPWAQYLAWVRARIGAFDLWGDEELDMGKMQLDRKTQGMCACVCRVYVRFYMCVYMRVCPCESM